MRMATARGPEEQQVYTPDRNLVQRIKDYQSK